ncbi:hypothetical protein [Halegenticoccus soli]|uniref:hypothetical protein n=1 Tax=Halegenticoccus soli TaxID=1985678 RepID=UPI001179AE52|nr:hypothetical protein [Halegenticoccus soli]
MSRRAPELALVTGVFLALSLFVSGVVLTGDLPATTLAALAVGFPFVAHAVRHADDPTDVLRPDAVLLGGATAGATVWAVVALDGPPASTPRRVLLGAVVAGALALPAAAYHVGYGERRNPLSPRATFALAALVAAATVGYGVLVGAPLLGSLTALALFLGGGLYLNARGAPLGYRLRRRLVVAGLALGVAVAIGGVVAFRGTVAAGGEAASTAWVVAGATILLGPSLYHALSVEAKAT